MDNSVTHFYPRGQFQPLNKLLKQKLHFSPSHTSANVQRNLSSLSPFISETEQICQKCIGHLQIRLSLLESPRNQAGQKIISSIAKGIDLLIVKKEASSSHQIHRCLSHYCHRQQKGLKPCGASSGASLCKINRNQFLFISRACSAWQGNKSRGEVAGRAGASSCHQQTRARLGLILTRTTSRPRQTQPHAPIPPHTHLAV